MIDGVVIKQLKVNPDERGRLAELLRCDDEVFNKFGQVYFTTAFPGVVKAWHFHELQDDHFSCIHGMIKLALYDAREGSATKGEVMEIFMGEHKMVLVRIPKGVYHGFKGIGQKEAIVVNVPTEAYNREQPDEFRLPAHTDKIPYDWSQKDF